MSLPNVDEVLNYLSVKFNKIFCERDFVCCVSRDFRPILSQKSEKRCVLLFPALGPIYLKALRYQARICDLAAFSIATDSGRFKSLAVCSKCHYTEKPQSTEAKAMMDSRKKRPERQLYVPPAQRRTPRLKSEIKLSGGKAPQSNNNDEEYELVASEEFGENDCVFKLSDLVKMLTGFFDFPTSSERKKTKQYQHACDFRYYLNNTIVKLDCTIRIYDNDTINDDNQWRLDLFSYSSSYSNSKTNNCLQSYPIFEFFNLENSFSLENKQGVIVRESEEGIDAIVKCFDNRQFYGILCESYDFEQNFVLFLDSCNYYDSQTKPNPMISCDYSNFKTNVDAFKGELNSECQEKKQVVNEVCERFEQSNKESEITNNNLNTNEIVKLNVDKKKKNEHEQEKEIMRKTKENINRKTKPIMKYVDDANDTLKIDKNDSVNNWEDLFDDDGHIQDELLTDIVTKVGENIEIMKASEDYSDYMNKLPEELEHVVELYNFPPTLATHDLVQAFSEIKSDAMYIKWVDDTHALLILGSLSQAKRAVNMQNSLIKARPMTVASAISIDVANKSDLKPAMKRPPTNLQTARRLITSHLGAKSKLTKEQMDKERQDLKTAREKKRLTKQNERDAWEGNIRSALN